MTDESTAGAPRPRLLRRAAPLIALLALWIAASLVMRPRLGDDAFLAMQAAFEAAAALLLAALAWRGAGKRALAHPFAAAAVLLAIDAPLTASPRMERPASVILLMLRFLAQLWLFAAAMWFIIRFLHGRGAPRID